MWNGSYRIGDLWLGTGKSEWLRTGEKTRLAVCDQAPRERPVSGQTNAARSGEILPLCRASIKDV